MGTNPESKVDKGAAAGTPSRNREKGDAAEKKASPPQVEGQLKSAIPEKTPEATEAQMSIETLFPPTLKESWQAEAEDRQAQNIDSARQAYIRRGLVLYIGAGVSCSVGLPTWWEMIRSLTVTMMTEKVDSTLAALSHLSEEQKTLANLRIQEEVAQGAGADQSLLIMARSIKDSFGSMLPYVVAQSLYRPLSLTWTQKLVAGISAFLSDPHRPPVGQYPVIQKSRLFNAIVQLARAQRDVRGVQAVVNFNYDDLIEEWMQENGIRCDILLSGKKASRDASLPCYHVHGVLPFRKIQDLKPTENSDLRNIIGNFVFSEDEYHTEYSDPYRWSNMTMINQLGRYSGLFVGLSLQDPNLRRLIDVTHRQFPDIVNYAILTRKTPKADDTDSKQSILPDLFEKVETESFENIGVRVIWTDNYDEVPDRIQDICNIDSPGNQAQDTVSKP